MVVCDEMEDGILIESEGSSYARYQGYIPNAKSYFTRTPTNTSERKST